MIKQAQHNKKEAIVQVKCDQTLHLARHIHFEQIDSTNTWAKMHPDRWAAAGVTLITASGQTAGRGRFKRHWVSPSHLNIYATFCFWMDAQRKDIGQIPQLLALTTAQMLEKEGFSPTIKWPNDLLLQGKKVAGILCETILEGEKRGIVCGIGLNVNMPREILNAIDRPATSLLVEAKHAFEVAEILDRLQKFFLKGLKTFLPQGFAPFFSHFHERSSLKKGQIIRFHDNQNLIEAQFEQLHSDGSVELRLSNGKLKLFFAGEFID